MAEPDYTGEIWKPIPFAPDYAASNLGRVKRTAPGRNPMASMAKVGHVLRPAATGCKRRYMALNLVVDGVNRKRSVHRCVATAFLGSPPTDAHVVAHNDGNGHNNRADNLRWATQSENLADREAHGTHDRGERNCNSKLTEAEVRAIRASPLTHSKLGRIYGVAATTAGKIKRGHAWGWLA